MRPKKVKQLIPELAKKLQLSEKEVESVLEIYWDKIRKTLSSLEHDAVFLSGLGTFVIKPWQLEKKIKKNDEIIEHYSKNPTTGSLTILNTLSQDRLKLQGARERLQQEQIKKMNIKHERRSQNLEGEEQDSGGD